MRRYTLIGLLCLVFMAPFAMGAVWNAGYEATPAVGAPVSEGDDQIRAQKAETRFRGAVEHWWGDGDGGENNDNGLHRLGSARCYVGTAAPTELSDSHSGLGVGAIADYDNTTGVEFSGNPDLVDFATNAGGAANEDVIGNGRCWIDTDGVDGVLGTGDDNKMYVYIGGTGWIADVWAAQRPEGDDEILAGSYNLIYNGSFEATGGDGDPASVLIPEGWTNDGTNPTYTYTDPSGDAVYGYGYDLEVTDTVGGLDQVRQTLEFSGVGVYKVMARVLDDGVGTCRLSTSGAAVESGDQDTAAAGAWVTVDGTFTTAAPDTVDINLISVTATRACLWDHVTVFRIDDVATDRDEISQPGVIALTDDSVVVQAYPALFAGVAGIGDLTITATEGNYVIMVTAHGSAEINGNNENCYAQITENVDAAGAVAVARSSSGTLFNNSNDVNWSIHYTRPITAAGSTYVYALEIQDGGLTGGVCDMIGNEHQHAFSVVAIPSR